MESTASTLAGQADQLAATLEADGLAVMPGTVDEQTLDEARAELRRIFATGGAGFRPIGCEGGHGYLAAVEAVRAQLTSALTVVEVPLFTSVATRFFARLGQPCLLNHDVIVTSDVAGTRHYARQPHFDLRPHLKLFAYLSDVELGNGPFAYVPGSHHGNRPGQDQAVRSGELQPFAATRAVDPGSLQPVVGPAGTVFIVDSSLIHAGSPVERGERLAMRFRSHYQSLRHSLEV